MMAKKTSGGNKGKGRLRVRMYCPGLGDCFLLTFYGDSVPRHILIDCGVFNGAPNGKDKIRKIAMSIQKETDGRLDAVVASHEHWDHVSGFYDAKDIFDPMTFGETWLAWTEDPSHPVARDMKKQKRLRLQTVQRALAQMAEVDEPQFRTFGQAVSELLGFFGEPAGGATLAAFSEKTAEAMAAIAHREPAPMYFKPGDLIERSWLPGVRIYVLGPPLDPATLKRRQRRGGTETYGLSGADDAFSLALEEKLAAGEALPDPTRADRTAGALPFHPSLQWRDEGQILDDAKFRELYRSYSEKDNGWRRIDHDWLLSVARLGLQLDSATNNTSLVLAIELTSSGEVLLFPADAQIASWKSWHELKWPVKHDGVDAKETTTADLLRHTVLYKVGHHGSHNATLREMGLELMAGRGLVAAIPVDQHFANTSKHWEMPAQALLERLNDLAGGRVLRADARWPTKDDQRPEGLSDQEWRHFMDSTHLGPDGLFIDYNL